MTLFRTTLLLILQATIVGCQTSAKSTVVHHVDPVLSNSMSCAELIDYLNTQNQGLHGWRCMDTQVHVSMPGVPLPQKLTGALTCSAPARFRLTADNFVGMADFGSNDDICWAYVKPGDPVVMTWHHEDSQLLEYVPGDFPRLEPEWLMVILGIQPLDAQKFQLQKPPAGSRELWLVSIEESASGQPLRRVIKVDPVRGVAREHALIDHNGEHLLRAQLSHHRSCGSHVLPHSVKISFPPQKTELTLNFKGIEANCHIDNALWTPPGGGRIAHVDLGDYVRQNHGDIPPRIKSQNQPYVDALRDDTMLDGTPSESREAFEEPEFDPRNSLDEALLADEEQSDGRFFGNDDPAAAPQVSQFESRAKIQETGFREAPDFDTVAPPASKTPWFGKRPRR